MVDLTKLAELVQVGIGGLAEGHEERTDAFCAAAEKRKQARIKRAMGTVHAVSDNVFVSCAGRIGNALRDGLVDIAVAECAPRIKWGKTPSSKHLNFDFPDAHRAYNIINTMLHDHAEQTKADYASTAVGMVFLTELRPVAGHAQRTPRIAFAFTDFGPFGDDRDYKIRPATGSRGPSRELRPRFHIGIFRSCLKSLAKQALAYGKSAGLDRKVRVALPRFYGSMGGVRFNQLVNLIVEESAAFTGIEFYIFGSREPDSSLICPTTVQRANRGKGKGKGARNGS